VPDWILHAVRASHALVENRYGGLFEITGGSTVPGLGRVETIKRQDGHWVVVTARGLSRRRATTRRFGPEFLGALRTII
jgi:hypothetical protein